jgi:phosphopantothenoylcysteine decarboxylase/phosphopantothenate--cysteine ligase
MNVNMWQHPAVQANLDLLRTRGVRVIDPGTGDLACGMIGAGRMAEPEAIADVVFQSMGRRNDLAGETVLVTAGGTREALDPVRYIGNRSSGKMGYALAEAARARGAAVILVSAPTALTPPAACEYVPVTSAAQMGAAVLKHLPKATVVVGAAAVADFRPASVQAEKIRREGKLVLSLEPTEDILRAAAESEARRPGTLIIAFAAETTLDVTRAREKMLAKNADAILLNDISGAETGFDADCNAGTFITADSALELPSMPKREIADHILDQLLTLRARHLVR